MRLRCKRTGKVKNDSAPTLEQIAQWLGLCVSFAARDRLFVHCKGGEGRTSTFCAVVRLAQGWDVERAIAEQRIFDFDPEGKHADQAHFLRALSADILAGTVVLPMLPLAI